MDRISGFEPEDGSSILSEGTYIYFNMIINLFYRLMSMLGSLILLGVVFYILWSLTRMRKYGSVAGGLYGDKVKKIGEIKLSNPKLFKYQIKKGMLARSVTIRITKFNKSDIKDDINPIVLECQESALGSAAASLYPLSKNEALELSNILADAAKNSL